MTVRRLRRFPGPRRLPGLTWAGSSLATTIAVLAAAFGPQPGRAVTAGDPFTRQATVAAAALHARYSAGSYLDTRSWQAANALQATIDYMRATGSRAYLPDVETSYQAHHGSDRFLSRYYDDEGWWALTWIGAYRLTGERRYLDQARDIFGDMTGGWDSTCGGGIWWSKGRTYKNAIANELFLAVAAQLHRLLPGDTADAAWAEREWDWFRGSGMITSGHLVVDGLAACRPVLDSPTWTYNQGVMIGGLVALTRFSHDPAALRTAREIAAAVIASPALSPGGILREPCEAAGSCDTDARLFKGIFMRNLKRLYDRVPERWYQAYMRANADSVWARDRDGSQFGLHWGGPFDRTDTAVQTAALDILTTQVRRAGGAWPGGPPGPPGRGGTGGGP
jgi:predicted alpha-1,6-mannanase (GH76 family)